MTIHHHKHWAMKKSQWSYPSSIALNKWVFSLRFCFVVVGLFVFFFFKNNSLNLLFIFVVKGYRPLNSRANSFNWWFSQAFAECYIVYLLFNFVLFPVVSDPLLKGWIISSSSWHVLFMLTSYTLCSILCFILATVILFTQWKTASLHMPLFTFCTRQLQVH